MRDSTIVETGSIFEGFTVRKRTLFPPFFALFLVILWLVDASKADKAIPITILYRRSNPYGKKSLLNMLLHKSFNVSSG